MGTKAQKQSLARRDRNGTGGSGLSGIPDNTGRQPADPAAEPSVPAATSEGLAAGVAAVPVKAGRMAEGNEEVEPKRYSPTPCAACEAVRPKGKNYTDVYCTRKQGGYAFRYCRCRYCGETWKDAEKQ
jgi:hypothetical protein